MCLSDREILLISSSFTKMHRSTVLKYLKVKQYTIPKKVYKTGWKLFVILGSFLLFFYLIPPSY